MGWGGAGWGGMIGAKTYSTYLGGDGTCTRVEALHNTVYVHRDLRSQTARLGKRCHVRAHLLSASTPLPHPSHPPHPPHAPHAPPAPPASCASCASCASHGSYGSTAPSPAPPLHPHSTPTPLPRYTSSYSISAIPRLRPSCSQAAPKLLPSARRTSSSTPCRACHNLPLATTPDPKPIPAWRWLTKSVPLSSGACDEQAHGHQFAFTGRPYGPAGLAPLGLGWPKPAQLADLARSAQSRRRLPSCTREASCNPARRRAHSASAR